MWLCSSKHTHIYVDTYTYNPYIYMINYYMLLGGILAKSYVCVCVCVCVHVFNDEDEIVRRKTPTLQTNLFTSQAFIFRTHTLKLFRIERARQFKPMIAFINEFVIELWMNAYIIIIGIGMYV